MEEYEEPEVDWSKVKVDTPILVRQGKNGEWLERHFAKYENGDVYAWVDGQTSWTGADKIKWKYAKLAENEKECKESKVDWSKVEVDTPILVRDYEDGEWIKRYFAKYKDGKVYAWNGGRTGQTESYMTPWKYAKLAEPEVDWSKVKVDTAIYVKASKYGNWFKRHFAEYKNGKIYTWGNGLTSHDTSRMMEWKYAKLVESEEERKELEVDWSKVEVDTPIRVRQTEDEDKEWGRRHFAKYENGKVYAWGEGYTSWSSEGHMVIWNYAKLAESEETK